MAVLGGSNINAGTTPHLNQTGPGVRETPQERRDRVATEERDRELQDAARERFAPGQGPGDAQRVTKKVLVRVRRNNGQAEGSNGTNGTNNTEGAQSGRQTRRNGQAGGPAGTYHMLQSRGSAASDLVRASVLFQNNQAQTGQQTGTNAGLAVRNKMLQGLNNYIQNDYQMMKLNPDDKAFTYRTAEARQLGATIGQMVASTSRQGSNAPKTNEETTSPRLSPEQFGRQKGLLRRLAAMSESNPKLPDNLPTDYRPFESVA